MAKYRKTKIWNYIHRKTISSNQLFCNFFIENVVFTKFLPKECESKSFFPSNQFLVKLFSKTLIWWNCWVNTVAWQRHTVYVEKREILSHWKFFSSNQLFNNFFSKTIAFKKFLWKKSEREFLQFPHCAILSSLQ